MPSSPKSYIGAWIVCKMFTCLHQGPSLLLPQWFPPTLPPPHPSPRNLASRALGASPCVNMTLRAFTDRERTSHCSVPGLDLQGEKAPAEPGLNQHLGSTHSSPSDFQRILHPTGPAAHSLHDQTPAKVPFSYQKKTRKKDMLMLQTVNCHRGKISPQDLSLLHFELISLEQSVLLKKGFGSFQMSQRMIEALIFHGSASHPPTFLNSADYFFGI